MEAYIFSIYMEAASHFVRAYIDNHLMSATFGHVDRISETRSCWRRRWPITTVSVFSKESCSAAFYTFCTTRSSRWRPHQIRRSERGAVSSQSVLPDLAFFPSSWLHRPLTRRPTWRAIVRRQRPIAWSVPRTCARPCAPRTVAARGGESCACFRRARTELVRPSMAGCGALARRVPVKTLWLQ